MIGEEERIKEEEKGLKRREKGLRGKGTCSKS